RQAFVKAHPYPTDIPTVSLATTTSSALAPTAAAAAYMKLRYSAASDGLVAQADGQIPGSNVVKLDGLDHACAAILGIPGIATKYRAGPLTQSLVTLALTTPPPGAGAKR